MSDEDKDIFLVELLSVISKLWAFNPNFYVDQVFNDKISILVMSSLQRVRALFYIVWLKGMRLFNWSKKRFNVNFYVELSVAVIQFFKK